VSFYLEGERYTVDPYSTGYPSADDKKPGPLLLRARCANAWRDFEVKFMSELKIETEAFAPEFCGFEPLAHVLCDVLGKTWPPK
jgi:hypothetical protein